MVNAQVQKFFRFCKRYLGRRLIGNILIVLDDVRFSLRNVPKFVSFSDFTYNKTENRPDFGTS